MTPLQFVEWLDSHQSALEAWGQIVVRQICDRVQIEIGEERSKSFFKVLPNYRIKDVGSAARKLEKKGYSDPRHQMTDLVGARFVVLLRTDIAIVERAIASSSRWTIKRDRDPLNERDDHPSSFDYQSVHYILRNPEQIDVDSVMIPAEIACEVQIRTLLQHAYAELGHDRIYKGEGAIPPSVRRLVARSMALMETTDEMFCAAVGELDCVNLTREKWANLLDESYLVASIPVATTLLDVDALTILDTFSGLLGAANSTELEQFSNGATIKNIKERASDSNLFGKPITLLVYWLVKNHDDETKRLWPIPKFSRDLEQIFSDLGIS